MLNPALSNLELGEVAETFVKYKLERWGELAIRPTGTLPYDLVVIRGDKLIKIQVKAKTNVDSDGYSYKFKTTQGRDSAPYEEGQIDMFAFVALDIEEVVFAPYKGAASRSVHPSEFDDGQDIRTWFQMLDTLDVK